MTTAGLFIVIGLFLVTLVGLAQPFFKRGRSSQSDLSSQKQRDELLTSYERVLATIRDLDEDNQTGKIAPATYQRERAYWTEEGIALLQALESTDDVVSLAQVQDDSVADTTLDDAIERAIAEYREVRA